MPKVLIAARDPRARAWVRSALGPGWLVAEAADGIEARRIATHESADLVIADETMESYGAFGLTRDLKDLAAPPSVLVLLERAQDSWLAGWSGADRWLVRPLDPFELAEVASELARGSAGTVTTTVGERGTA